ncbi:MAG TPA: endolytic transglycosylase MltG [Leucothrix sp.]|nr:endolytic transglycosylase MltG [Leucothrix sp.]
MKFIFKVLLPMFLLIAGAAGFYFYIQFDQFRKTELPQDIASFEIKKGSHIRRVAKSLKNKNIIKSELFFVILAKLNKQDNKIKAGEFALKQGMTPDDLLNHFSKGKTLQYQTRIPEGGTFKELVKLIKADKNLKQTLTDADYSNIMQKLKTKYQHHQPEGWFFPDTFSYPRGTTDLQFLQRAHNAMLKALDNQWKNRTRFKGINTPYDALVLASIIEKETGNAKDRTKVARVFLNRLEKDMLLQTDPTVIYGMGDSYKGNIRKKDLKKDTPYNTYTRKGLPPTPIATAGLASIEAVFAPADGEMLYFVAKQNGDGMSYFSKTYKEHQKAVIKYLLNGKASRYKGNQ